jgi:LytS/YehU family sensor histidine kinase
MAAFELSPAFFLNDDPPVRFFAGFAVLTFITLLFWYFNIYIYSVSDGKDPKKYRGLYFFSYLFALFVMALFMIFANTVHPPLEKMPSLLFPLINSLALNTIILIIISSVVNRSKKEQSDKELAILKIKNLEAEQEQLVQQLQPHFLFNALSTLKSLINANAGQAEEYLVRLSDFLRFTISSHANKLVSLDEELKFAGNYIKLQQIRFGNSFFCEIDIPDVVRNMYEIPVYALQTLVENAIKHNAFMTAKPLYLYIIFKEGWIEVKNNKILKTVGDKGGVGLKNLDKRYSLIGGEHIVIDNKPDYFLVSVKLIPREKRC